MCWAVIHTALLQTVIIRITSEVTKAGQLLRSGISNKAESIGISLIKSNLSLLRPRIFKIMTNYL